MTENDKDSDIVVSIRCLAYNQEKFIRQCLEGFVKQKTNFRFEAIVHDDASTDGTPQIILEYANKYPDIIKPILEKENQYSKHDGSIRRIMDAACVGKYIAYCEGDDYWTDSYKLQKQVDILETDKNVMMVYTGFDTVDEGNMPIYRFDFDYNMRVSRTGFVFPYFIFRNVAMTVSSIFRREVFFCDIKKDINNSLDYLTFLSAAAIGSVVYLNETTCCYRKTTSSLTNIAGDKVRQEVLSALDGVTEAYEKGKIKMGFMRHVKTNIYIAAKGIDLVLRGFGYDYMRKHCVNNRKIWFLPLGLMLNLKLNAFYYLTKITSSR